MAGYASYTALLDACVLHPILTCDALMSLASVGLYAAKWSQQIEQEWIASLEARRPDLAGKLLVRRNQMREAVPDWEVDEKAWKRHAQGLELPDPNDAHVLAAAVAARADCIVTANTRDFPSSVLEDFDIEAIHPDTFIVAQWDLDPLQAAAAFKRMRARRKKPEATVDDFLSTFERAGLPTTAQRLRTAAELI